MSDECERPFSSCKIHLEDRRFRFRFRFRLQMDIIKANECLRHWYGPPVKGSFNNTEVGVTEGELQDSNAAPDQIYTINSKSWH